jgi:hypothetical protein
LFSPRNSPAPVRPCVGEAVGLGEGVATVSPLPTPAGGRLVVRRVASASRGRVHAPDPALQLLENHPDLPDEVAERLGARLEGLQGLVQRGHGGSDLARGLPVDLSVARGLRHALGEQPQLLAELALLGDDLGAQVGEARHRLGGHGQPVDRRTQVGHRPHPGAQAACQVLARSRVHALGDLGADLAYGALQLAHALHAMALVRLASWCDNGTRAPPLAAAAGRGRRARHSVARASRSAASSRCRCTERCSSSRVCSRKDCTTISATTTATTHAVVWKLQASQPSPPRCHCSNHNPAPGSWFQRGQLSAYPEVLHVTGREIVKADRH